MRLTRWTPLVTLLLTAAAVEADEPKTRDFLFHYKATVTGLEPGQSARVWLPVPATHEDQDAGLVTQNLPLTIQIGRESKFGNLILYTEAQAGPDGRIPLAVTYRIRRREVLSDKTSPKPTRAELDLFLKPDAKVPLGGKPQSLLKGRDLPVDQLATSRIFYDVVNNHMKYSKDGIGWGRGDAVWACDSKFGNCSDFHSLFISLARSNAIPAKFEMGF
ncbi:MAG: transglutaminase domain-containing protein, partial [Planctomycetales bacterium]|nr:transglutaminase domain-containing protein [Planctomycetales bacterium]